MKIIKEAAQFTPVTITLESQEELDFLWSVMYRNTKGTNLIPAEIEFARQMENKLAVVLGHTQCS